MAFSVWHGLCVIKANASDLEKQTDIQEIQATPCDTAHNKRRAEMITKEEAMVELRAAMEPALEEISAISQMVDQEFDKFAEAVGLNGAHKGLKEALWLIEYEMEFVKAEGS